MGRKPKICKTRTLPISNFRARFWHDPPNHSHSHSHSHSYSHSHPLRLCAWPSGLSSPFASIRVDSRFDSPATSSPIFASLAVNQNARPNPTESDLQIFLHVFLPTSTPGVGAPTAQPATFCFCDLCDLCGGGLPAMRVLARLRAP